MRSVPLPDAPERAGSLFDRAVKERLETPLAVSLPVYTYQELIALTPASYTGVLVRCSNWHAGSECLAYCTGQAWKVIEFRDTSTYTTFDSTGHQTMVGNARPWRDELGELLTKKKKGARITEDAEEGTVVFATNCVVADDHVILNVQLNHDKDLSAGIYPHLHFFQTEDAVPNFLLQYRWQVNGAAKTTSWLNLICTNLAFTYVSGTIQQIAYSAAIVPPASSDLSDIVQFKICRDTANVTTLFPTPGADPFTTAVHVLMFDVHFQINSLGSTDALAK